MVKAGNKKPASDCATWAECRVSVWYLYEENWIWLFPEDGLEEAVKIPWSPRSPNIILFDFFLWGYVKDKVYATTMITL